MRRFAFALGLLLAASAAGGTAADAAAATAGSAGARQATRDYRLLQSWLAGSFSSHAQAARDTSFRDIRLHIVDIWPGREGGRWYYVEQAVAGQEDAPYRQRVYRLTLRDDGRCESAVFTLPSPARFIGGWRLPAQRRLATLTADSLGLRDGCAVYLRRQGERFVGGTEGTGCASDLRGARYATSEVELRADRMVTLDRGFAADGQQVWGSEHGGYVFLRVAPR